MTKVHPNDLQLSPRLVISEELSKPCSTILTVWKKSLVINCNGFTVFDSCGNLLFRVDNYASNFKAEVVLMDAAGNALLTVRRKRLSLQNEWQGFLGELLNGQKPMFTVRRPSLLRTKGLAEVYMGSVKHFDYQIEGSYSKRSCTICDSSGDVVAQVKRKQATSEITLGGDVFNLVVQPGYDQAFIMGLIVIIDQITSSR